MTQFDEMADYVVVGSGAGGMCAALIMRAAGKSVVVLEKTDFVGGTTARSGGVMWIPNNPFMAPDGVEDSFEKAKTYLDNVVEDRADSPGTSPARRETYLREAPRAIDFLLKQGIKLRRVKSWPDYYDELPGGSVPGRTVVAEIFNTNELGTWRNKLRPGFLPMPATLEEGLQLRTIKQSWATKLLMVSIGLRIIKAKLLGQHWVSAGAALQGRMLQAALRNGADIRTNAPVTELIAENDAITGVVTLRDGKAWRIGGKLGVLINAGGYARNQRMRDQYQPGTKVEWSNAGIGDTGEMIEEMMRHGAAIGQMEEMIGYQSTLPPGSENDNVKPGAQALTASPHAILVDQSGVRYMNEGGSYMAYCRNMLERHKTVPAVPSWAILDSQFMRRYMLAGSFPGMKKPKRWSEEGYLRQAPSIAGLAEQLGMVPAVLEETVARFNLFVGRNRDEDFGRGARAYDRWLGDPFHQPSETLGSIAAAPFFAVPIVPGDVSTLGGVVTDSAARVLRADGTVIPGLYATGVSSASVMGRAYPGAGSSIGPSMVWGYIAAQHGLRRPEAPPLDSAGG